MSSAIFVPEELHLLKHPFYQAWMTGSLSRSALQDYARQYYHHVEAFPRYLENTLSLCRDPEAHKILSENLADELGTHGGRPHPQLWLDFSEGTGVSTSEVTSAHLRRGIRNLVDTFEFLSKASLPQALGALYAYESQVPEIAASKIQGLRQHFAIEDEKTLGFFAVHSTADIYHREALKQILDQLSEAEGQQAQQAARTSAQALWDFLSDVSEENHCA